MITPHNFEEAKQQTQDTIATSPWTEPFQRGPADTQPGNQDQQATMQRPPKIDPNPTHDALSAIFNGD